MKQSLSKQQQSQEDAYFFPYHYFDLALEKYRYLYHVEYLAKLEIIEQKVFALNPHSVLDAGCGDGRLCYALKKHPFHLVGIDYSEQALRFARAFNPDVEFECGDLTKMKPGRSFDVILCIDTLEHIEPNLAKTVIEQLIKKLNPNGHLIITVPSKNLPLRDKHYQHFSADTLEQLCKPYASHIRILGLNMQTPYRWLFSFMRSGLSLMMPLTVIIPLVHTLLPLVGNFYKRHLATGDPARSLGLLAIMQRKEGNL